MVLPPVLFSARLWTVRLQIAVAFIKWEEDLMITNSDHHGYGVGTEKDTFSGEEGVCLFSSCSIDTGSLVENYGNKRKCKRRR